MLWLLENPQPSENPDFGTQAHTIHVGHIYLHLKHLVDFYGFHVIKYASPMDPMRNSEYLSIPDSQRRSWFSTQQSEVIPWWFLRGLWTAKRCETSFLVETKVEFFSPKNNEWRSWS